MRLEDDLSIEPCSSETRLIIMSKCTLELLYVNASLCSRKRFERIAWKPSDVAQDENYPSRSPKSEQKRLLSIAESALYQQKEKEAMSG